MALPGFAFVTPFIFSQSAKEGGFNICLYLALPLPLKLCYGKVRRERGGGFQHNMSLHVFASVMQFRVYRKIKGAKSFLNLSK